METTYLYEALDTTECTTRIIRPAGAQDFDAPLHCEMLAVRLKVELDEQHDERPQYEVISYTWEG